MDGREKQHMKVNYGGSSGIGERCFGSNNDLHGSCWRTGGIASVSVGGEVERARKEDDLYR